MWSMSGKYINMVVLLVVVILGIRYMYFNISIFFAKRDVKKNPTEENADRVYQLLKAPLGVAIKNHPDNWADYRDMFYIINGSSYVPTELKEKLKARLVKKGLYIKNMKIIDNCKGGISNV